MHILFIATALIMSQFIILGCCDSDTTSSLTPVTGSIASIGSFDKYGIASFGNGPMGLASDLQTSLTQADDGSILKSRNLALVSYGSELLNLNEFSSLTSTDTLGNEFSTEYEKTATLKDCSYPFALIQEDLTTISVDGTGIGDTYSNTLLLLPDVYSADDLAMFTSAFGDSGTFNIKTFKYTFDINAFLTEVGSTDLSTYDLSGTLSQLNGASAALLTGTNMTGILRSVLDDMVDEINAQNEASNEDYNKWASNGGVSCNWAEISVT
jgi:hypothetical protein